MPLPRFRLLRPVDSRASPATDTVHPMRFPSFLLGATALLGLTACAGRSVAPTAEPATPARMSPPEAVAPPDPRDALPAAFRAAFAEADSRARTIAYWYQCVGTIARLRAGGTFGPAAAAPRLIYCERTGDGIPIGGVYDIDPAFRTVRRFSTVRLDGVRPRYSGAIDTARVATEAKLVSEITRAITPAWAMLGRPFSVVPVPLADGGMEAWAIPRATKARTFVTGGDVAYARNADGTSRRVVDRTATWTQRPLAAAGPLEVPSAEREVAAVTDLVTARYHTDLGRDVTVHTTTIRSALVAGLDPATGARVVWRHVAKPTAR